MKDQEAIKMARQQTDLLVESFREGVLDNFDTVMKAIIAGDLHVGKVSPHQISLAVFQVSADYMGDPSIRPAEPVIQILIEEIKTYLETLPEDE